MKKILALFLVSLSFILSSCSGASRTIDLTISDYHFEPDTFTVPAGEEITVNIEMQALSHTSLLFLNLARMLAARSGRKITKTFIGGLKYCPVIPIRVRSQLPLSRANTMSLVVLWGI